MVKFQEGHNNILNSKWQQLRIRNPLLWRDFNTALSSLGAPEKTRGPFDSLQNARFGKVEQLQVHNLSPSQPQLKQ